MEDDLKEQVLAERQFLHDLSNLLVVAQGMGNFVFKSLKDSEDTDVKDYQRMSKTVKSIEDMVEMVKERRNHLYTIYDDDL